MSSEKRFYPTAKVVNGKLNRYWAPPPVHYKNSRRVVQEDLENTPRILAEAQEEWNKKDSLNSESADYLAERLKEGGRLVILAYGNTREHAEQFKVTVEHITSQTTLPIVVYDTNQFNKDPKKYIKPGDKFLVIGKSGATSSTNYSAQLLSRPAPGRIFFV